jgi:hypothetical protein
MLLHLKLIGLFCVGLALLHVVFPKRFGWKQELQSLSLLNRQLMYVHTFLVVLLIGILCLTSANDLIQTRLGKQICLGLAIFWGLRLVFQVAVYSPALWRGKRFETVVHIVFSILWTYFTGVFLVAYRT